MNTATLAPALAAHLAATGQVVVPRDIADELESALPDGAEFRSAFLADGSCQLVYWIGDENEPSIVRRDTSGEGFCFAIPRASARI